MTAERDHVDVWITILAPLLNPITPAEPLKALQKLAPHLRAEFSDPRTFSAMAARCVAAAERFGPVPDFGVICRALREYRATFIPRNAPKLTHQPQPAAPPTQAEIDAVAAKLTAWRAEKSDMPGPLAASERQPFKPLFLSRSTLDAMYAQQGLVGPSVATP